MIVGEMIAPVCYTLFTTYTNTKFSAHTQEFLPPAFMNTKDYGSTGHQSNPSISGNLNTMNGHLNPPIYNQVETRTNGFYSPPISFCDNSVYRSDMTNNGPTD